MGEYVGEAQAGCSESISSSVNTPHGARNTVAEPYQTNFPFPITTGMAFNRSLWKATGAQIGGEVGQCRVGFVTHRADDRDGAISDRPHDQLVVEAPQILYRPAPARDDYHIGARHRAARHQGGKAAHGMGDLLGAALALHDHGPHDDAGRETVGQAV